MKVSGISQNPEWTVTWIGGGDKGEDRVIAPTQKDAIAQWLNEKQGTKYFLSVERA